jgi:hypothetical protein
MVVLLLPKGLMPFLAERLQVRFRPASRWVEAGAKAER